jgi:integrase
MGRIQAGYAYADAEVFYVRYRVTKILTDGQRKRIQPRAMLRVRDGVYDPNGTPCAKGDLYYIKKLKKKTVISPALKLVIQSFIQTVNVQQANGTVAAQDMRVVNFWEQRYLPYCEEIIEKTDQPRKKPSTMKSYKQLWRQHLKPHFDSLTLNDYTPNTGTLFLQVLADKQHSKIVLKHIKALASSIFKRAVNEQRIKTNPWHDVQMPDDAIESEGTKHYTLAEVEDMISALVDNLHCQLILAFSCFLAIRPGEIAALRWEDFDSEYVHIRRSGFEGNVTTPKTLESVAPVPLIDQVRVPLELWRQKCGNPSSGYVFESRAGTPIDMHNVISRIIIPTMKAKKLVWKGLYAGRRGACTNVIEATNGNYAVAQALLRHKSMKTTLDVYKKQITPQAFKSGMELYEQKALAAKNGNGSSE